MANRKDRREQERRQGGSTVGAGGSSFTMGVGGGPSPTEFVRGTQFPHGFMVMNAESGPGQGDPEIAALPVIVLDNKCMREAVGLQRLFDLQAQIGTVALNQQMAGQNGWSFSGAPSGGAAQNLLKFKLRLEAPFRVHTDLLLIADNFVSQIKVAAASPMLGLLSPQGLQRFEQNPPENFTEGMERCVIVATPRSMVLKNALMVMGA